MFKSTFIKSKNFLKDIGSNIVFIPAVGGFLGSVLAVIMYFMEDYGISSFLIERLPYLVINNYDTASTLLSTFSAGVLSILVFSFSMVMLLLNQAGTNFSPRVLPGLISVKRHQYIIGLFLGSILYNTIVLVGLRPTTDKYQLPGFSVLLGIMITTICLFSFIYFIDSISRSIQVQNIISKIYRQIKKRMIEIKELEGVYDAELDIKDSWTWVVANKSGYLQAILEEDVLNFAKENEVEISIDKLEGSFIMEGEKLIQISKELDEDKLKLLYNFLVINRKGEDIEENYLYGFKQIAEIGVRAMSPGVNDPATAITTIEYLTELFGLKMSMNEGFRYLKDEEDNVWIQLRSSTFAELLYQIMVSYRTYSKSDMNVVQKLLLMLIQLKSLPHATDKNIETIDREIELLNFDVEQSIKNPEDLKHYYKLQNGSHQAFLKDDE